MARDYVFRNTESVDFDTEPSIEGRIVGFVRETVQGKERPAMDLETGDRLRRVWHSEALAEVWKRGEPGMFVALTFLGKVPTKNGQTFNRFSVALWREKGAAPTDGAPKP